MLILSILFITYIYYIYYISSKYIKRIGELEAANSIHTNHITQYVNRFIVATINLLIQYVYRLHIISITSRKQKERQGAKQRQAIDKKNHYRGEVRKLPGEMLRKNFKHSIKRPKFKNKTPRLEKTQRVQQSLS